MKRGMISEDLKNCSLQNVFCHISKNSENELDRIALCFTWKLSKITNKPCVLFLYKNQLQPRINNWQDQPPHWDWGQCQTLQWEIPKQRWKWWNVLCGVTVITQVLWIAAHSCAVWRQSPQWKQLFLLLLKLNWIVFIYKKANNQNGEIIFFLAQVVDSLPVIFRVSCAVFYGGFI